MSFRLPTAPLRDPLRRFTWLSAAQFFLIIANFWILKPLKKAHFVQLYDATGWRLGPWNLSAAQAELVAKNANVVVALVVMGLFWWASRKWRRHRLQTAAGVAAMALLAAAAWQLHAGAALGSWLLYLGGDTYNMLAVTALFACVNDVLPVQRAPRALAPIVLGGVVGGAVGSTAFAGALHSVSAPAWLLVVMGVHGVVIALAHLAARPVPHIAAPVPQQQEPPQTTPDRGGQGWYFVHIGLLVTCYEMASTIVDYLFTDAVSRHYDDGAIGAVFGTTYLVVNLVAVITQVLLTRPLLTKLGVGRALLILPTALLVGLVGFAAVPAVLVAAALCVVDNGLHYSLDQSAKETLYVPADTAAKYRAKAVIDVFVQRASKLLGIGVTLGLSVSLGAAHLAVVGAATAGCWLAAAKLAGGHYHRRAARPAAPTRPLQPRWAAPPG